MKIDEKRIKMLMDKLKISREEALELEGYDDDVNHDRETEYDLTPEQVAFVQDMTRHCEHKKYGHVERKQRTANELKIAIMAELAEFLREDAQGQPYEDVEITNISRMLHFKIGDREFDLQLIEKRHPKTQVQGWKK